MAFELIFGEGTKPGSRPVFEKLLKFKDRKEMEGIFDQISAQISHQLNSIVGEEARNQTYGTFSTDLVRMCFDLCVSLCSKFTPGLWRCGQLDYEEAAELIETSGIAYLARLFEHFHRHLPGCDMVPARHDPERPNIMKKLSVVDAFLYLTSITEATSMEERFACLAAIELLILEKDLTSFGPRFIEFFERNEYLEDFVRPSNVDIFSMKLADQMFLWYFLRLLGKFVKMDQDANGGFQEFLLKRDWYTKLMNHLATFFTSKDIMARLMWLGQVNYFVMAFTMAAAPLAKTFGSSIFWLCNALTVSPFARRRIFPTQGFSEISWTGSHFYLPVLQELISSPESLERSIGDASESELGVCLDLLNFFVTTNFVIVMDYLHSARKTGRPSFSSEAKACLPLLTCAIDVQVKLLDHLEKTPNRRSVVFDNHAFFVMLVARLKAVTEAFGLPIVGDPTAVNEPLKMLVATDGLNVLLSEAVYNPGQIKEIVKTKEFLEGCCGAFYGMTKFYNHLATPELNLPENYLRLRQTAAICCVVSTRFLINLVGRRNEQLNRRILSMGGLELKAPLLVAVVLKRVLVNQQVREDWLARYGNELRSLACACYAKFLKSEELPIDSAINYLTIFNTLVGKYPMVRLSSVLNNNYLNGRPAATLFRIFLSKLLPGRTAPFFTVESLSGLAQGPNETSPEVYRLFHSIGVIVAGITVATLAIETRGSSFHNILVRHNAGRQALMAKMAEAIENVNNDGGHFNFYL